jgi:hypothetical protein
VGAGDAGVGAEDAEELPEPMPMLCSEEGLLYECMCPDGRIDGTQVCGADGFRTPCECPGSPRGGTCQDSDDCNPYEPLACDSVNQERGRCVYPCRDYENDEDCPAGEDCVPVRLEFDGGVDILPNYGTCERGRDPVGSSCDSYSSCESNYCLQEAAGAVGVCAWSCADSILSANDCDECRNPVGEHDLHGHCTIEGDSELIEPGRACTVRSECPYRFDCIDTPTSGKICTKRCYGRANDCENNHCWGPGDQSYCTYPGDPAYGVGWRCPNGDECPEGKVCLDVNRGVGQICYVPCSTDDECPAGENRRVCNTDDEVPWCSY